MTRYVTRRLLTIIPLLFVISVISFLIIYLSPGDPVAMYMNPRRRQLTPDEMAAIRHKLGVDRPIYIQYVSWLSNTLQGDWGYSFASRLPVRDEILSHLPNTLLLGGTAILLAVLVAMPLGTLSALKQYTTLDYLVTTAAFIGISLPSFWFALLVIQLFANRLGWLPSVGMRSMGDDLTGLDAAMDVLKHLILPALVLSMIEMAYWTRYQRSSLLEVIGQDYVRTARAKGLTEGMVTVRHMLRNALIPVLTLAGLTLPELVAGSYIVETIFGWPGMGRLGVRAVLARDYPVVMGVTMLSALLVVGGNLLADMAYTLVDPRIRRE